MPPRQSLPETPALGTRQSQTEALRRVEDWLRHDSAQRRVLSPSPGITVVDEAGAGRSAYTFDRRGDLVTIVEPRAARTTYAYDHLRRLLSLDRPRGPTRYNY